MKWNKKEYMYKINLLRIFNIKFNTIIFLFENVGLIFTYGCWKVENGKINLCRLIRDTVNV